MLCLSQERAARLRRRAARHHAWLYSTPTSILPAALRLAVPTSAWMVVTTVCLSGGTVLVRLPPAAVAASVAVRSTAPPPLGTACSFRVEVAAPTDWLSLIQASTMRAPGGRSKKPIVSPAAGKLGSSDGSTIRLASDTPATRFCTVLVFLRWEKSVISHLRKRKGRPAGRPLSWIADRRPRLPRRRRVEH